MMLSGIGTKFIVGDKEIRELVAQLDHDQIRRLSTNKGIDWNWNPAVASYFGGVFKVMIKGCKTSDFGYF